MKTLLLYATLTLCQASLAQAPATPVPPANQAAATGICKDGSFTTTTVKDGACHNHKGLKTWYGAASAMPSLPTPTPVASLPSRSVPTVTRETTAALPVPTVTQSATTSLPSPTSVPSLPSRPVATPGTATFATRPTPTVTTTTTSLPTPQPAQLTVKTGIAAERARIAAMPPAEGGGPGLVWVNNPTKIYHCPGSDFYGKTKSGAYMTEAEAKASGAHPNRNKPCS